MALKALSTPQFSTQRLNYLIVTSSEVLVRRPACSVTTAMEYQDCWSVQPSGQPPGGPGTAPGERVLLRDANTPMLWYVGSPFSKREGSPSLQCRYSQSGAGDGGHQARIKYALCAREHSAELGKANKLHRAEKIILLTTR